MEQLCLIVIKWEHNKGVCWLIFTFVLKRFAEDRVIPHSTRAPLSCEFCKASQWRALGDFQELHSCSQAGVYGISASCRRVGLQTVVPSANRLTTREAVPVLPPFDLRWFSSRLWVVLLWKPGGQVDASLLSLQTEVWMATFILGQALASFSHRKTIA